MFRLLQPVEELWKELADYLLKDDLQYKIGAIESDCYHDSTTENAFREVVVKWRDLTPRAKRTWQTLCVAAKKHGDESLEKYLQENGLQSEV